MENLLQIVMGTMIPLIKWEYLDHLKDSEESNTGLGLYLELTNYKQLTLWLWYGSYTRQKGWKLWSTMVKKEPDPSSLFDC